MGAGGWGLGAGGWGLGAGGWGLGTRAKRGRGEKDLETRETKGLRDLVELYLSAKTSAKLCGTSA